ncbi:phosphopantheine-transferase PgaX [Streptomyces tateyamensis]|uniref:Phosphopantheine-transferase PgaX n=1 Tax=Streptomyces tateyamensis TaxID=565073 RepID=A0A2V4NMM6_9ACTN|nr:4'-phosphopantetheinyl transferase superfamily protein [Streptomyces tateyamensis]PYC83772.1 phosphopantheine-transferase PgaX [Streptomyces tateyamensis]
MNEPTPRTPVPPVPEDDWLDLWLIRPPKLEDAGLLDLSELDAAEHRRAASFIRPVDRVTYSSAHIGLRRLLGGYLDLAPQEVAFTREPCPGCAEPHGRPAVAHPPAPVHFSLSHCRGLAMVGVAPVPVGVDVELRPRPRTVETVLPALHPGEQEELTAVPLEARLELFGRVWTRKEAYLKGLGTGLSRAPGLDYLGADPSRRPPGWTVLDVPGGPFRHAAVAVVGTEPATTTVRWLPPEVLYADGAARLPELGHVRATATRTPSAA